MTKKHFIALADHIKAINSGSYSSWSVLNVEPFTDKQIQSLSDFLRSQNAQFNRDRWLAYIAGECGPNGGKVKVTR